MAADKKTIMNMALGILGNSKGLTSVDELSPEGNYCRLFIDSVRGSMLEEYDWNWASGYQALAGETTPEEITGFEVQYDWPNNCLAVREICRGFRSYNAQNRPIEYQIANPDGNGKKILTRLSSATARITRNVTDYSIQPNTFDLALAGRLASFVETLMSGVKIQETRSYQFAQMLMNSAMTFDANQGFQDMQDSFIPESIAVRS